MMYGSLQMFLPPLDEQKEIVMRVSTAFARLHDLLIEVDRATDRLDQSAQAILAKAFRGELTTSGAIPGASHHDR